MSRGLGDVYKRQQNIERLHKLSPQYVERTLALVEDEAKFPHERQNTVDRYQHHEQLFRVICTTVVIIAGFVAAGTLAYFEAYTAASIAVGATLVGLASAFVGNASKSQKERRP